MGQKSKAGTPGMQTLYCSFCGKSQHEVAGLIAGPFVFICNECILFGVDILSKEANVLLSALHELNNPSPPRTGLVNLKQIQFASVEELVREAGLENSSKQLNGYDVLAAVFTAFDTRRKALAALEGSG